MKKWFEYYCQFFNTVELNVTFYRYPKLEALKGWYDRSPDDFRFTVKAPRLITHFKKFKEAKREANDFYELTGKGLQAKLGTVLFQLHPKYEYSSENLDRILNTLDPAFANVLEFRHESWWTDAVISELKRNNISFCGISYPGLPEQVMRSAPFVYYRFHGIPQLYKSPYSIETLSAVAGTIKSMHRVDDVYIYFNNDIDVAAIDNARDFRRVAEPGGKVIHQ